MRIPDEEGDHGLPFSLRNLRSVMLLPMVFVAHLRLFLTLVVVRHPLRLEHHPYPGTPHHMQLEILLQLVCDSYRIRSVPIRNSLQLH